jgi:TrmH family RNA methyltransferase
MLQDCIKAAANSKSQCLNFKDEYMLTKSTIKLVQSLQDKKHRKEQSLFVAEGEKIVSEVLASKIKVKTLFATSLWLQNNSINVHKAIECIVVDEKQMKQLSAQSSPPQVLAVCMIEQVELPLTIKGITLLLDTIQDPGNMGTIMRIADWYGITRIICSESCADVYNPKVIQASMGSFTRVAVCYARISDFIKLHATIPVYGAMLQGKSIYDVSFKPDCMLLIGNEGHGISNELLPLITYPICIPKRGGAESLNAAVAAAIICDTWARSVA